MLLKDNILAIANFTTLA